MSNEDFGRWCGVYRSDVCDGFSEVVVFGSMVCDSMGFVVVMVATAVA